MAVDRNVEGELCVLFYGFFGNISLVLLQLCQDILAGVDLNT